MGGEEKRSIGLSLKKGKEKPNVSQGLIKKMGLERNTRLIKNRDSYSTKRQVNLFRERVGGGDHKAKENQDPSWALR